MVVGLLGRYIGRMVVRSTVQVALVLMGLYLSLELVDEAGDLGEDYGVPQMLAYLARTAPARVYDLFPFAVLVGGMVALGRLAAQRELVAMRACGFHRRRIIMRTLATALLLGLVVMLVAELLVPRLELQARVERERAQRGQVSLALGHGLWVRDGPYMIKAGLLVWEGREQVRFADLRIYRLADDPARDRNTGIDQSMEVDRLMFARSAHHTGGRWRLDSVTSLHPENGRLAPPVDVLMLDSRLSPGVFRALATRPRLLPIRDIQRIRGYLEANEQDATAYVQALWRRALYPVNMIVMLFSGIVLLFRFERRLPPMASVFVGVSLGIAFFVLHRLVLGIAPVLPLPIVVTHLIPALLFGGAGVVLLRSR